MDEVIYKAWWPLHLRAVSGETLSSEERTFYEVKLAQLHQDEVIQENVGELREARAEIQRLEAERLEFQERRQQLQAVVTTTTIWYMPVSGAICTNLIFTRTPAG